MRKSLIIVIVANIALYIGLALWIHHRMPYGITKTNLSASQVRATIEVVKSERLKWSRIRGLSAHAKIACKFWNPGTPNQKTPVSYECDITLRQTGNLPIAGSKYIYPYEITMENKQEGWVIRTDGTQNHTEVQCIDER